jgi:phosphomannomutase
LRRRVYEITGRLYSLEDNIPSTPEMRVAVPRRLKQAALDRIGPHPVLKVSHEDGTKFYLANDNWALVRFSGTEPMLRLFVEADSPEKAKELIQALREFVTG